MTNVNAFREDHSEVILPSRHAYDFLESIRNLVVPSSEHALAGTYIHQNHYRLTGTLSSYTDQDPATVALPEETVSCTYDAYDRPIFRSRWAGSGEEGGEGADHRGGEGEDRSEGGGGRGEGRGPHVVEQVGGGIGGPSVCRCRLAGAACMEDRWIL
ncbi:hypothetical protein ACWER6_23350 [Streptomyces sp. NPDC004009]